MTLANGATVTATFSAGQLAFGVEMWPNNGAVETMVLDLGGGNVLTFGVDGSGDGAPKFFGFVSTVPFTTMTLSDTTEGNNGFLFGNMQAAAAVPLPPSVLLLGSGLLGLVGLRRRFKK